MIFILFLHLMHWKTIQVLKYCIKHISLVHSQALVKIILQYFAFCVSGAVLDIILW